MSMLSLPRFLFRANGALCARALLRVSRASWFLWAWGGAGRTAAGLSSVGHELTPSACARSNHYLGSNKARRRKTTGTGRCRHLKTMPRRFKNGFMSGTEAKRMISVSSK